ncbi:LPS export ABC transporter periplasmic protein LptC [Falsihalocynthiibacter sp. SS001]|uniref:LPS export ABC transporter periplasmic protein LptC n=1 Tax=Falsihalocynthiibacter sp. SS001 TaxID=3349698 RepID=UPI0036D23ABC
MFSHDNTYSRFISWAKIILPLLALAILSTVFLLARPVDPTKAIPFAKVDVEEMARERGITSPNYSGITRDGAAISVSAASAKPDPYGVSGVLTTEGFNAQMEFPEGATVEISSTNGKLDSNAQRAQLEGQVLVTSSTGYVIRTERVDASLADARFTSDVPISAAGPIGKLNAGAMELTQHNQNYLLVFKNGVKLVYDPQETIRGEQ